MAGDVLDIHIKLRLSSSYVRLVMFGGSVAGEKTGLETMECDTYH